MLLRHFERLVAGVCGIEFGEGGAEQRMGVAGLAEGVHQPPHAAQWCHQRLVPARWSAAFASVSSVGCTSRTSAVLPALWMSPYAWLDSHAA